MGCLFKVQLHLWASAVVSLIAGIAGKLGGLGIVGSSVPHCASLTGAQFNDPQVLFQFCSSKINIITVSSTCCSLCDFYVCNNSIAIQICLQDEITEEESNMTVIQAAFPNEWSLGIVDNNFSQSFLTIGNCGSCSPTILHHCSGKTEPEKQQRQGFMGGRLARITRAGGGGQGINSHPTLCLTSPFLNLNLNHLQRRFRPSPKPSSSASFLQQEQFGLIGILDMWVSSVSNQHLCGPLQPFLPCPCFQGCSSC